jgi:hypothetical protein
LLHKKETGEKKNDMKKGPEHYLVGRQVTKEIAKARLIGELVN